MGKFTADFETTTDLEDCRVWAFGICEIGNPDYFVYGNSIEEFMELCEHEFCGCTMYFHNAKFDFQFIISYLLHNGFTHIQDKSERADKTFMSLITGSGQFFSLEIYFKVGNKRVKKVKFLDSYKILAFKVEKIAKDFNLPLKKLELDYKRKREIGHILTDDELNYLRNDVEIMSRALNIMFERNLNKMTIASNALSEYKDLTTMFNVLFPVLDISIDSFLRKSYKGGFTYLNPFYKEQETSNGLVFDKNSMYPAKMYNEAFPIGYPIFFEGKYFEDKEYPLYIQQLSCIFKLKSGKIPSIQIKNQPYFKSNEYLEDSKDEIISLTLTSVDLQLFMDNYDVEIISWDGGYKFMSMKGLFNKYIDKWTLNKIQAKKDSNGSLYTISKLMLNSLYGKFGLNPKCNKKEPYLDDKGVVKYRQLEIEERDSIYVAIASYITSYARKDIIETSQKIRDYSINKYGYDGYIYSDTDSIHCLLCEDDLEDLKQIIDIDDYKLGSWKLESRFKRGKYLRQKCYIEQNYDDEINVVIAGFPKSLSPLIKFDNFKVGFSTKDFPKSDIDKLGAKLTYKYVKGGVVLVDTDFEIK